MRRPMLAWFALAVVLGSSGAAGAVSAEGAASQPTGVAAEIDPGVRAILDASAPGEKLAVIVTLRDQAALASITAPGRASRLRAVVQALRAKANESQRRLRALLETRRAEGRVTEVIPFWIFNGLAVTATPEVVREIAALPRVGRITLDRTIEAERALAAMSSVEPNVSLVNAPGLWELGFRGEGIVVAAMDTGVDGSHPDLAGRWRGGTNSWFDPNGEHPTPFDPNGHGTWTTGVMVGGGAGGTTIGVAPDARWVAVKIFDDRGVATTARIHEGFQWLLDPDGNPATPDAPHVVNNSWSMGSVGCDLEFQLDLRGLRAAGILPVFAAGNFGPGPSTSASPANNPEAFAVGAVTNDGVLYSGSGRGPSACGEPEAIFPELVAPGVDVRTSDLFGLYTRASGTSIGAPHVAGALALLLDALPDLSADVQEEALERGGVDLGAPGPDNEYGHGRLDALASYGALIPPPDPCDSASPIAPAEPVPLCGESTISGSSAGVVRVAMPRDVILTVGFGPSEDVEIDGAGDFVGFALIENTLERDGFGFVAGRYPAALPGSDPYFWSTLGPDPITRPEAVGLAAGEYLLYLLADGSPATVTLRLDGLGGRVDLAPARPASYAAHLLLPGAARHAFGAGGAGQITERGVALVAAGVGGLGHLSTQTQACVHAGSPPPETAFAPGCPRTDGGTTVRGTTYGSTFPSAAAWALRREWLFQGLPSGPYLSGAWWASASGADRGAVMSVLLGFDA